MHANIVKIRLQVRSRPKIVLKSERMRKLEKERVKRGDEEERGSKQDGAAFTSREGALAKGKTGHRVVFFPLFHFLCPLAALALFTFARTPRSTPESVRADSFFRPSPLPKNLCLGLAGLSPSIVYSFSLFSFLDQAVFLLLCYVVDFQLKPEIRSNIRLKTVRRMGTFSEIRLVSMIFFIPLLYEG